MQKGSRLKKNKTSDLKKQCSVLEKKVTSLETQMEAADRYSRRLNLRLYGIPERGDDKIKKRVEEICSGALPGPEAATVISEIDVVQRLRRRQDEGAEKHRPVIIRFTSRTARDTLWKGTKKCDYLKINRLYFKEDLSTADKEARSKLWPEVEEAPKRGDEAYFVGNRAYINGKEIQI